MSPSDALCFVLNIACPEPSTLFDEPGGRALFCMLAFTNVFTLLLFVSVNGGFVSRLCDEATTLARELRGPAEPSAQTLKAHGARSLTILLPCYLPNEHPILLETITHIIERLEYGRPFKLVVCYNTPTPMPFEATLRELDGRVHRPSGRSVRILGVEGSRSKAENLNAALALVTTEHVALYDADHHPDPSSLLIATAHMAARGVSCVQGSTYLRHVPNLLAAFINAEFFVTHFVFFPAMEFLTRVGVFGGSNALWKTADLRRYHFHNDVQTEDIDLSTRALLSGHVTISFCPACRSGELPPASFTALYRQRLRWAIGWDQVTMLHAPKIWSSALPCATKAAMYYLLPLRWALLFATTLNALVAPAVAAWWARRDQKHAFWAPADWWAGRGGPLGRPIEACLFISSITFFTVSLVVLLSAAMHEPCRRWPAVLCFQLSGLLYIFWQLALVLISLAKICSGADGGWVVTARAATSEAT